MRRKMPLKRLKSLPRSLEVRDGIGLGSDLPPMDRAVTPDDAGAFIEEKLKHELC